LLSWIMTIIHEKRPLRRLGGCTCHLATDLDTKHGGTGANKRDAARQLGRLNVADLEL